MVRLEGIVRRHWVMAACSALVLLTACVSDKDIAKPVATTPSSAAASSAPRSTGPAPSEWLSDLEDAGTALYVSTHSCPGQVTAGVCTIKPEPAGQLKAFPLTLWRYADGNWQDLGQPGVFSFTTMQALPGGLLFVPLTDNAEAGGMPTGPLRVSVDEGKTWADWEIPQQQRRCRSDFSGPGTGPCQVIVAGDYVVITSNYGWVRRQVGAQDWEDITPPKRKPVRDSDDLGYGALALSDGTLIATVAGRDSPGPGGYYLVSRDAGSTWSAPHANPGTISEVDGVDGSTLYATCWKVERVSAGSTRSSECGRYRTTDLEHWTRAAAAESPRPCRRESLRSDPRFAEHGPYVRFAGQVYGIATALYVTGHEATRADLERPGQRRLGHLLERSADGCKTWTVVLGAKR